MPGQVGKTKTVAEESVVSSYILLLKETRAEAKVKRVPNSDLTLVSSLFLVDGIWTPLNYMA